MLGNEGPHSTSLQAASMPHTLSSPSPLPERPQCPPSDREPVGTEALAILPFPWPLLGPLGRGSMTPAPLSAARVTARAQGLRRPQGSSLSARYDLWRHEGQQWPAAGLLPWMEQGRGQGQVAGWWTARSPGPQPEITRQAVSKRSAWSWEEAPGTAGASCPCCPQGTGPAGPCRACESRS